MTYTKQDVANWKKDFDAIILRDLPDSSEDGHDKESFKSTWTYETLWDGYKMAMIKASEQKPEGTLERELQDYKEMYLGTEDAYTNHRKENIRISNIMFEQTVGLQRDIDFLCEKSHFLVASMKDFVNNPEKDTVSEVLRRLDEMSKQEYKHTDIEIKKIPENSHLDPIDTFYLDLADSLGGMKEGHVLNPRAIIVNPEFDKLLVNLTESWYQKKSGANPPVASHMKVLMYGPRTNKDVPLTCVRVETDRAWTKKADIQ